jgi:beta-lactamase regulating signal transducer with metallopeptidase domain
MNEQLLVLPGSVMALGILTWLATYALHSTLLLGGTWVLTRSLARDWGTMRDSLWKAALVGGLLTASVQTLAGVNPYFGNLRLAAGPAMTRPDSEGQPLTAAAHSEWPASGAVPGRGVSSAAPALFTVPDGEPAAGAGQARSWPMGGGTEAHGLAGGLAFAPPAPGAAGAGDALASAPAAWSGAQPLDAAAGPARPAIAWSWAQLAVGLWLAGAAAMLSRFALLRARLFHRIGQRRDLVDGPLVAMLARLCRTAGLRPRIFLTSSANVSVPIAFGTREICLPERALTELRPEQQESILAHELAHLVRRDPLWLLLSGVLESIFFFQPLQRLARRQMQQNAETLCDDWAVRRTGTGLTLARCLIEVARWLQAQPQPAMVATMAENGSPLVRRIERLLADHRPGADPARSRRLLAGASGAALLLAAVWAAPGVSALAEQPAAREAPASLEDQAPAPEAAVWSWSHSSLLAEAEPPLPALPPQPPLPARAPMLAELPELPELPEPALAPMPPESPDLPEPPEPALAPMPPAAGTTLLRSGKNNEGTGIHRDDDKRLEVRLKGEIELADDDRSIVRMERGSRLQYLDTRSGRVRQLSALPGPGGQPQISVQIDGRPAGAAEATGFLAEAVLAMVRNLGIGAEARVRRILEREGVQGVFTEVEQLEGSSARVLYLRHLLEQASLQPAELRRVLVLARAIDSDGLKGQLLHDLAPRMLSHPALQAPFLELAATIDSDGVLGNVLAKVLQVPELTPEALRLVLGAAAENIESDGVLGNVLERAADRFLTDPALVEPFLAAAAAIDSDGVLGSVLGKLLKRRELDERSLTLTLRLAAEKIESSGVLGSVLAEAVAQAMASPGAQGAFFEAAAGISSDGVLGSVLERVLQHSGLEREARLRAIVTAGENIDSDGVLASLLLKVTQAARGDEELRQAVLRAAESIDSDALRGRVLSELFLARPR